MKSFFKITTLILIVLCNVTAICQTKKPVAPINSKSKIGPLRTKDYPYYILVKRGAAGPEYKSFYTLPSYNSGKQGDFTGGPIVLDVRTGKEVSWWTLGGENYYFSSYNMLVNHVDANFKRIIKFDTTGLYKGEFFIESSEETPVLGRQKLTLSTDWKKAIAQFNNDLWMWDFDLERGIFSNPSQVTSNGVMGTGDIYLKGNNAVVNAGPFTNSKSHIVNLSTGKYTNIGNGVWDIYNNEYIDDVFFVDHREALSSREIRGYWSISSQKFAQSDENSRHYMWMDRKNTVALAITTLNNGFAKLTRMDISNNMNNTADTPFFSKHYKLSTANKGHIPTLPGLNYFPVSPSTKKIYYNYEEFPTRTSGNTERARKLGVVDFDKGVEKIYDISLAISKVSILGYKFAWTDDDHLLFNAALGSKINGLEITEANQGTYILDLQTGESKRLTPYLIEPFKELGKFKPNQDLKVFPLKNTEFIIFVANNYLFRCKKDGSELVQMIKFPGVYTFEKTFLSEHMEIP